MFLKSLELQGFKSFPDKTVLNFGSGITAVVGPNGSGKSNISDAIRWVLGEQSTKNLRGAKMEDVIFGGTRIRKALGFAEVTLRLDNSDRSLEGCDKDEVSVGRRYYRSGESEYIMNGETVRLRDIHELFMDTGLGRDGYSMVSQGRVADMISSRSSQRREMLEEAAGISAFRYRRLDATRKLDQAEENLIRLRDILAELESRIGPLKIQSEKAQKFIVLAAERKELEIGLWLHTIEKSRKGLIEQEHKLSLATAQYEQAEYEINKIEQEIEQVISAGQQITVEIEALRAEVASLEETATRIDGEAAVNRNTVSHNEASVERLRKDMEKSNDDDRLVDEQVALAEKEIQELQELIEEKNESLRSAVSDIGNVRDENSVFAEKSAELSQRLAEITVELSDEKIKNTAAQSSIEEIKGRSLNIDAVIDSRSILLTDIESEEQECSQEIAELRTKVKELSNVLEGYRLRAGKRKEKADALKEKIDDKMLDAHQKLARAKMLEDLEKNMEGYSGSVRAVMKESRNGALRGIHGTVAQLISVKEEYAVAVETAFGAAIQHIVTDNENDAKRAIEFLKQNRAGRATFLPMTSVKAKPFKGEEGLEDCYGFVDMADKLVEFDEKYGEIIRSEIGRTVVAEDIDCAIAMAKKYGYGFKIVTLDGQIINAGGSMTGGSRGHNSGFLSRTNEIEKLRTLAKELNEETEKLQQEHKQLLEELSSVEADLLGTEGDLKRAEENVIRRDGDLKLILDRKASVGKALSELREERSLNDVRIAEHQETVRLTAVAIAEKTREIDSVQEQLGEIGRNREELERRREELNAVQSEINLQILSAQKDIEARQETITSCMRSKQMTSEHLLSLQKEIEEIEKQNIETEKIIEELTQRSAQARQKSAEISEHIKALIGNRASNEARDTELRQAEKEKLSVKETLSSELARLEERKNNMENALESAKEKLYDEYSLTLREAEEVGKIPDDPQTASRTLQEVRNKIRALGNVNVGAVEEYKEVSERFEYMSGQINDIEKSKEELLTLIGDLTGKMSERFREQFSRINSFFGETFSELFDGGKAELVLDDPSEPLECNISIRVQPPGKNVQNIDLLSGGEKGLSAIALLFAILKVSPAPFCVYDEVEAALDDVNVTRYAQYVRRMTKNTQFILITHRRGTMEEADILYGVTMQEEGVSKLLELKTAEMAKRLGISNS